MIPAAIPARHMPWYWATSVCRPFRRQRWSVEVRARGAVTVKVADAYSLIGMLTGMRLLGQLPAGARVRAQRLGVIT